MCLLSSFYLHQHFIIRLMHEVPLYKPDLLYRTNYFKNSGSLDSSQQETVDDVVAASCRGSLLHVGPPPPTHTLSHYRLISCLLSPIHYQNKGEHAEKINGSHPICN